MTTSEGAFSAFFPLPLFRRVLTFLSSPYSQLITLTGPLMHAGPELAEAASQGLGTKLEFQSIKESEAKKVLKSSQGEELDEGAFHPSISFDHPDTDLSSLISS